MARTRILFAAAVALVVGAAGIVARDRLSRAAGLPQGEVLAAPLAASVLDAEAPAESEALVEDAATTAAEPRTYNVVLITIDTLRWDLGYMGYPRPISPNLDRLAERSTVFERAYATASYTPKSVGPLLIGRYASETYRDGEHYTTFYPANVFVAERVKSAGHRTLAAMCHHYFKWKTLLDQGFDVWDTSATPAVANDNDPTVTSDKLTDVAIGLLSDPENVASPTGRFFAWFHFLDPHLPYVRHEGAPDLVGAAPDAAPPERAIYDEEVWFTDKHVGRLIDHIASQPWAAETAIVITSDHGEAFGERGFYRHGRELWEPLVRVPLVVHVPDAAARRVPVKRSHVDLVPTILDLLGIPAPAPGELRGASLVPDVTGDPATPRDDRDVYMDMPRGPFNEARRALITNGTPGLKLIDFGEGRYELYDLEADPLELQSVHGDRRRLAPALERLRQVRGELREVDPAP